MSDLNTWSIPKSAMISGFITSTRVLIFLATRPTFCTESPLSKDTKYWSELENSALEKKANSTWRIIDKVQIKIGVYTASTYIVLLPSTPLVVAISLNFILNLANFHLRATWRGEKRKYYQYGYPESHIAFQRKEKKNKGISPKLKINILPQCI